MEVIKKMQPGQPGTKRYIRQYGESLICVRYRRDAANARRLTTVELIVDEGFYQRETNPIIKAMYPNPNRNVYVRVGYEDGPFLSSGERARSNAELVEEVTRAARSVGREVVTPDRARMILGIKQG